MIITCTQCGANYEDVNRWTICPHGPLDAPHDAYCRKHDLAPCPICDPTKTNPLVKAAPQSHTPGPLEVIGNFKVADLDLEECELFEITTAHEPYQDFSTTGYAFSKEDAKLYAASPDLLDACRAAHNWLREYHTQHGSPMDEGLLGLFDQIEISLKKATVCN